MLGFKVKWHITGVLLKFHMTTAFVIVLKKMIDASGSTRYCYLKGENRERFNTKSFCTRPAVPGKDYQQQPYIHKFSY